MLTRLLIQLTLGFACLQSFCWSLPQWNVTYFVVHRQEGEMKYELIDFGRIHNTVEFPVGFPRISGEGRIMPTVVLLHGLGGSKNATSNEVIANGLLDRGGFNIIAADYMAAFHGPDYDVASNNVQEVGTDVGLFLVAAQQADCVALDSTTVVGFSLGAHVAGVAGHTIQEHNGYLQKIIGLDPAGPNFESVPNDRKLDKSDAGFVMVVHTAGGYLALLEPLGHVDFYPNGGTEVQPLCRGSRLTALMCSHMASYLYLGESIGRPGFIATKCPSWDDFTQGRCIKNEKAFMGFDADSRIEGTFYLNTNSEPPFGSPLEDDSEQYDTAMVPPEDLQTLDDIRAYHHVESGTPLSSSSPLSGSLSLLLLFILLTLFISQ